MNTYVKQWRVLYCVHKTISKLHPVYFLDNAITIASEHLAVYETILRIPNEALFFTTRSYLIQRKRFSERRGEIKVENLHVHDVLGK